MMTALAGLGHLGIDTMNTYYLRATEADWPILLQLGVTLGAIEVDGSDVRCAHGGVWDYIGPIYRTVGEDEEGNPITEPIKNGDGEVLLHCNLTTPLNLGRIAAQMAHDDPLVAESLSQVPRFFVVDERGRTVAPAMPHRVLFL